MSALVTVRAGLTYTEAVAVVEFLELVELLVRADWNGERAVKVTRVKKVADRLRLEMHRVTRAPPATDALPKGAKLR